MHFTIWLQTTSPTVLPIIPSPHTLCPTASYGGQISPNDGVPCPLTTRGSQPLLLPALPEEVYPPRHSSTSPILGGHSSPHPLPSRDHSPLYVALRGHQTHCQQKNVQILADSSPPPSRGQRQSLFITSLSLIPIPPT